MDLEKRIAEAEKKVADANKELESLKKNRVQEGCVAIARDLFDRFVKTGTNAFVFKPEKVTFLTGDGRDQAQRISYVSDGIAIKYYSRITMHLGDYDNFVDRSVIVDGKVVCNDEWM
jgi:hypothetical protein